MAKIEITRDDLNLIESAILVTGGGRGFGYGAKNMKVRTLKGIFETTDGLREFAARMRNALAQEGEFDNDGIM